MSLAKDIILAGAGGHARACIDVIEQHGIFRIRGLIGVRAEVGTQVLGYPVLGVDTDLPSLVDGAPAALVTVGQIKSPELRITLFEQLERLGCALPAIISPRAYVSRHATVGAGSIVLHGAIINAGASVGRNCIINSQALVEHDARIDDHCHIATTAAVNSGVAVGRGSFIGSAASIRQGTRIGQRCVIGMGQAIWRDCADDTHVPPLKQT